VDHRSLSLQVDQDIQTNHRVMARLYARRQNTSEKIKVLTRVESFLWVSYGFLDTERGLSCVFICKLK